MENEVRDPQKDNQEKEDALHSSSKGEKSSTENGSWKSRNSLIGQNRSHKLTSNSKRPQIVKSCSKHSIFHVTPLLDKKIPRHLVLLDEKYLRCCLELIHTCASKSARCNISLNWLGSMKTGILSYHLDSAIMTKENTHDLARFGFEFPLAAEPGNFLVGSATADYKSIMLKLDRPLLRKLGRLDFESNAGKFGWNGVTGSISCDVTNSPGGLSDYNLLKKQEKGMMDLGDQNYAYGPYNRHKRFFSASPMNSTYSSDHSLSSTSATFSQGTLQCIWKDGVPHFVFALDDQKEIYFAELSQAESGFDGEALDYSYLIHLRKGGAGESYLVGKIMVSTTFTLSTTNSKIMEREFILFANGENSQIPCQEIRKNKGLPKRVIEAFRNSRSSRQRSISRLSKSSFTHDFSSWEMFQETTSNDLEPTDLLENDPPPNLESTAIICKDYILEDQQQEVGGWGMRFLKKASLSQNLDTLEALKPLMSMNVIIPAGVHGGPRTRNGGPSSLIERWKSGGICDCGGWDLGCPLTVFKGQARKDEGSYPDGEGQCKLLELFIEGSKHGVPGLRIVNVHDGLYFLQFQPKLSTLQSFSVAVAYTHSQNSRFRPKNAHEL